MSHEFSFGGGYQTKNVQPGKESNMPVCPNYQLIEICAEFAGIDPNDLASIDDFCGYGVKYENTLGFLSGHRGNTYHPRTTCTNLRDKLNDMMDLVTEDIDFPKDDEVGAALFEKDLKKREELLMKEVKRMEKYNKKQIILDKWREAVYQITCVPPESKDPNESHFKPVSINELTENEVIGTVGYFLTNLEENITGKNDWKKGIISLFPTTARHCPQSPHFHQTGEIS
jgi:hypothetical protein